MNLESLLSVVSGHSFADFSHVAPVLERSGFSLEPIQTGKDPAAPHGEVFRAIHAWENVAGILKLSGANSVSKLKEDLVLSHQYKVSVPNTHIFPVGQSGSLIVQPFVRGKAFESMSDDEYHFVLETLPQLRREILRLMDVFHQNFPTDERAMSRYPDLSGNRAAWYAMRKWMNLFIISGETRATPWEKLISTLEIVSPKTCLVDTGWAIHETTQQRFTREGIKTHEYFRNYLTQIIEDNYDMQSIANGQRYLGQRFIANKEPLGYLTPTHIATFGLSQKYAEHMVLDEHWYVHVFRPNNRETPLADDRGNHYVWVIEKHGSHEREVPPQYSHQVAIRIVQKEVGALDTYDALFEKLHPASGMSLKWYMEDQYSCVPENVTHFVLQLLPDKAHSILQ